MTDDRDEADKPAPASEPLALRLNDQLGAWQPIETAPRDGTKVLLVNDSGAMDIAGYVEQWTEHDEFVRIAKDGDVYRTVREECGYWDTAIAYCPTHWMPLPAPPQGT